MARRRELVGIADAVAVLFCCRTNDFEGAWLPGVLCARAVAGGHLTSTVDLMGSEVSDPLLSLIATRSRDHIDRHLASIGLESRVIASATFTVTFRPRVPSLSREDTADPVVALDVDTWWFTVSVTLVDDLGTQRRGSRQEWCWAETRPLPIGRRDAAAHLRAPKRSDGRGPRLPAAAPAMDLIDHSAKAIAFAEGEAADGNVRIAGRALRDRLRADPSNVAVRQALAKIYRDVGHPEQAGRYEVTLPRPRKSELEAYVRVLVATDADDAQVRALSILPETEPLPELLREELEKQRVERVAIAPWGTLAVTSFVTFTVAALLTLLLVFFIVLIAPVPAVWVARVGGLVCSAALACGFAGAAGVARKERRGGSAAVWLVAAIVAACATVLGVVALLVGIA